MIGEMVKNYSKNDDSTCVCCIFPLPVTCDDENKLNRTSTFS